MNHVKWGGTALPCGFVVACLASTSSGALMTYTDEASFVAASGPLALETFESSPTIGDPSGGGQAMLTFGSLTASSTPDALKVFDAPSFGNMNVTPGGSQYLAVDTDIADTGAIVTFTFDQPTFEFGSFVIDVQSSVVTVMVEGEMFEIPIAGDGSVQYFGVVSDMPITSISFDMGTDSFNSFDDIRYTIPTPGAAAIMSFAGLMALRRRR